MFLMLYFFLWWIIGIRNLKVLACILKIHISVFFKEKLKQFKFKLHKTEPQKSFIRIKHQTTCLKKFKLFFLIVYSKATIIELKKAYNSNC